MRVWVATLLLVAAQSAAAQDCVDPAAPVDDCDNDGFSRAENDCNDEDPTVNPDAQDLCGDGIDQNCNREVDDDCDLQDGELSGGSVCGAEGGWAILGLPLFAFRRRRST